MWEHLESDIIQAMKISNVLVGMTVMAAVTASAAEWKNVDAEHYLGGRKASAGYLQGKVVLVDRWGLKCPPCRALLPRVEEIWRSFKTKPFVVLGGHCKGWGDAEGIKKLIAENGLTYAVYEDAGLAVGEPEFDAIPFLYVVDETGSVVYMGRDERAATQAVVQALTDLESPRNLAQWKHFLDYELETLPGRAYLRMTDFVKKFPQEAKAYDEKFKALKAIPDVKKLSELVAFAKKAKDPRIFGAKEQAKKAKFVKILKDSLTKYGPLKDSKNPKVSQEAKNSLADIKWTLADQ